MFLTDFRTGMTMKEIMWNRLNCRAILVRLYLSCFCTCTCVYVTITNNNSPLRLSTERGRSLDQYNLRSTTNIPLVQPFIQNKPYRTHSVRFINKLSYPKLQCYFLSTSERYQLLEEHEIHLTVINGTDLIILKLLKKKALQHLSLWSDICNTENLNNKKKKC